MNNKPLRMWRRTALGARPISVDSAATYQAFFKNCDMAISLLQLRALALEKPELSVVQGLARAQVNQQFIQPRPLISPGPRHCSMRAAPRHRWRGQ